jgi:Carboxypeptidase regulatory-like domain
MTRFGTSLLTDDSRSGKLNSIYGMFPTRKRSQSRMNEAVCSALVWLLVLATSAGLTHAQLTTADVVGTVTDGTGAVVAGASVVIVNNETGASRSTSTSSGGDYAFSSLDVGTYNLTVKAKGFAEFEARSLKLAVGDRLRLDATLQVGQQAVEVEVNATAAALQTDSSSVGTMITDRAVQDLPLNGRNYINLVQLSAGVAQGLSNAMNSGSRPDDRRLSSSYSANGQTDEVNNNLLDGMDNNERFIGTIGVRPSIDAVQEVRVITNLPPAELGRTAGAVVDLITKSGTNQLHGSAFEFFRNDAMDANNFFANRAGLSINELRQNQFGGSLGGPIIKDKTFFFGDYEGYRQVAGTTSTVTVPTAFEHANPGNLTDIGGPVIPASQLNPLGTALFSLYPEPNGPGISNNFTSSPRRTQYSTTYDGRVDHHISASQTLYGRYSFNDVTTFTPNILPQTSVNGVTLYPGDGYSAAGGSSFAGTAKERAQNVMLGYVNVLTPRVVLELKAGYLRTSIHSNPLNYGSSVANALGFTCNSASCINVPGDVVASGLPFINMGGGYESLGDANYIPLATIDNSFLYQGSVGWNKGAHNLKFGAGLIRRQLSSGQSAQPRGEFDLNGNSVQVLSSLLTGIASTEARNETLNFPSYRSWEPSFYAQDDWHVRRWLTLNIGLRYDVFTPFTEHLGQFANFNLNTGLLYGPDLPGVQHSGPTAGVKTDYGDVAPRFGFAATIGHGMVIRGGFGMTFWPGNSASGAAMKNAPYTFIYGCGQSPYNQSPCSGPYQGNAQGAALISAALPIPVINPVLATNPALYRGTTINATDFNAKSSYLEQYTIQVQKELGANIITVGYVGNLGRHLTANPNINLPGGPNLPLPFPTLVGTTINQRETGGVSEYNALQLQFQRRFSHGLTANVNYTYANATGNTPVIDEGPGSAYNCVGYCLVDNRSNPSSPLIYHGWQQYDMGNTDEDVRNAFTAMVNYELPFGNNLKGVAGIFGKGWAVNVIGQWDTGQPFTVTNNHNQSGIPGLGSDRPDQIGSTSISNSSIAEFFNTGAFALQTAGTLGNEKRNQIFGPSQRHLDVSVFKEFPLKERFTLQFRAEVFNLTNTPNFAAPASTFGNSNFGTISSTAVGSNPRQIQLALKLLF